MTDYSEFKGVNVTMAHFRSCKYCASGIREGFSKYDLDYVDFLTNGIDGELLLQVTGNDAMVRKAVEVAHGRRL